MTVVYPHTTINHEIRTSLGLDSDAYIVADFFQYAARVKPLKVAARDIQEVLGMTTSRINKAINLLIHLEYLDKTKEGLQVTNQYFNDFHYAINGEKTTTKIDEMAAALITHFNTKGKDYGIYSGNPNSHAVRRKLQQVYRVYPDLQLQDLTGVADWMILNWRKNPELIKFITAQQLLKNPKKFKEYFDQARLDYERRQQQRKNGAGNNSLFWWR